ncbi:MAG: hypothetical protein KIT25_15410 [Enhydrobacter sp.]|nr:MAG: hypothetical protein KIT25_15410 [Enhydrobacter sp.]
MTSASEQIGPTRAEARWRSILVDDAPPLPLAVASLVVFLAAAWLLASPSLIVSRHMTWDMLFNLAGAWHLVNGHEPHVDFHDPLGSLSFYLSKIGFLITGPSVGGFIVGEIIAATAICVAAFVAALRRLPLLPAAVFVGYSSLLILMPTNVGDSVHDITFAMSYNTLGWAALGVLSLIFFVPPRGEAMGGWPDLVVATLLILALYDLKITYFGAAMAELAVALAVSEPIRRHARRWLIAGAAISLHAIAPYNWPYLADIFTAIEAGAVNNDIRALTVRLFDNVPELSLVAIAALTALGLWRSGDIPLRLPAAVILLVVTAAAMLSQNTQTQGLTLSVTIAFLLYDYFRGNRSEGRAPARLWILVAALVFPLIVMSKQAANLAIYYRQASLGKDLFVFDKGPLRGLAVPAGRPGLFDALNRNVADYTLLNRIRSVETGDQEISQFEYARTLLDAAQLFEAPDRRAGSIVLFDQVNPLPFILQRAPARGVSLWLAPHFPWLDAEDMLGDASYVLVPKFSTSIAVTRLAVDKYTPYLDRHFSERIESRSWFLYVRKTPRRFSP